MNKRLRALASVLTFSVAACSTGDPPATATVSLPAISGDDGTGTGGTDPVTDCTNDGYCNLAYCDLDEDPDCVEGNCDSDGTCNPTCESDPDCSELEPEVCDRETSWGQSSDSSICDDSFFVRSSASDPAVAAAQWIKNKWPNWDVARSKGFDEDNDGNKEIFSETCWRKGHRRVNLEGFGASLTRGTCAPAWEDIGGVENDLRKPSILLFEKHEGENDSTWQVIGAAYHFRYSACNVPCFENVPRNRFVVHEAGWHNVPGNGGFTCIKQEHVKETSSVVVSNQCHSIDGEDFTKDAVELDKHGRVWTMHMWFEPDGDGVSFAVHDPWCRWMDDGDEDIVSPEGCTETTPFWPLEADCGCTD